MATIYEELQKGLTAVEAKAKEIQASFLATLKPKTPETDLTAIMKTLSEKLLATGKGIVSTEETPLEKTITEAISGIQTAAGKRETGIKAATERAKIEAGEIGERKVTSEMESRRGFATNTALMRQLEESTTKSLRDLDLREQEALASGQMEAATQIAQLKIQKLQFQTQQEQSYWTQTLQAVQLGLQAKGVEAQAKEAEWKRATDTINLFKDFDLASKLDPTLIAQTESTLGLKKGALSQITPKKEEVLDFYATDARGNVTAIYRDKKTNTTRTQIFKGIGASKTTTTKPVISQATLNKLANAGVPNKIALGIQADINIGWSLEAIRENLGVELGDRQQGMRYLDIFMEEMKKVQSLEISWPTT